MAEYTLKNRPATAGGGRATQQRCPIGGFGGRFLGLLQQQQQLPAEEESGAVDKEGAWVLDGWGEEPSVVSGAVDKEGAWVLDGWGEEPSVVSGGLRTLHHALLHHAHAAPCTMHCCIAAAYACCTIPCNAPYHALNHATPATV